MTTDEFVAGLGFEIASMELALRTLNEQLKSFRESITAIRGLLDRKRPIVRPAMSTAMPPESDEVREARDALKRMQAGLTETEMQRDKIERALKLARTMRAQVLRADPVSVASTARALAQLAPEKNKAITPAPTHTAACSPSTSTERRASRLTQRKRSHKNV